MRLIDADALLKELPVHPDGGMRSLKEELLMIRVRQTVQNAPTIGGWISVKSRLPERKATVIVSLVNELDGHRMKRSQIGYLADDTGDMWFIVPWGEWAIDADFKVTHWMPLPEPPEEVQKCPG